jgi:O-antigen/teichoic acid export membrane protein
VPRRRLSQLRKAFSAPFLRAVTVLSSGALLAQIISFVGGAVLARYMYPPAAQDLQASFAALLATVAPILTLRYDAAIVLPAKDEDARHLCWLNLFIAGATTALVAAAVVGVSATGSFRSPALWALPLAVLAQGLTQPILGWCTRKGLFVIQSAARIAQAIALPLAGTLAYFTLGSRPENLPWALTASLALSLILLLILLLRTGNLPWRALDRPSRTTLSALARSFRRLPLVNTPMNLADLGSQAVLIWCLTSISDGMSACFVQATTVLRAPMLLLGMAVAQVYAGRAARLVDDPAALRRLTRRTILSLCAPALGMAVVITLAGPWLFAGIYGEPWRLSGEFSQFLVWGFACNLIISPVSMLPTILHKNVGQLLQSLGLGASRLAVGLLAWQHRDPLLLVISAAAVDIVFNLLFVGYILRIAGRHRTPDQPAAIAH